MLLRLIVILLAGGLISIGGIKVLTDQHSKVIIEGVHHKIVDGVHHLDVKIPIVIRAEP